MALLSLIFDKPKSTQINASNGDGTERELLILDMTKNLSHSHTANPTEHPIEDGSIISDHIDLQNDVLSFEGIMSEAPITLTAALVGNVAGAIPAIGGSSNTLAGSLFTGIAATLGGLLLNAGTNRAQEAHDALLQIQKDKIPVTIITGLMAYNNMVLSGFNPIENAQIGNSLSFTATFKEIKIVQSEQIVLPASVLDKAVQNKAASKQKLGKKTATEKTSGSSASLASRLTGIGA